LLGLFVKLTHSQLTLLQRSIARPAAGWKFSTRSVCTQEMHAFPDERVALNTVHTICAALQTISTD